MAGQNVDLDQGHILNQAHLLTQLRLRETGQDMTSHVPLKIGKKEKTGDVGGKRRLITT